jgi:hypothetical protein
LESEPGAAYGSLFKEGERILGGLQKPPAVDEECDKKLAILMGEIETSLGRGFDAVITCDGGYCRRHLLLTRATIVAFADGRIHSLGGSLAPQDGFTNYETEMAARNEGLAYAAEHGARFVAVIFDATSPVLAAKKFRCSGARNQTRAVSDIMLASSVDAENRLEEIVNVHVTSHLESKVETCVGSHTVNAAVDSLCDTHLADALEGIHVPYTLEGSIVSHKRIQLPGRGSDRAWMSEMIQKWVVDRLALTSVDTLRAQGDRDILASAAWERRCSGYCCLHTQHRSRDGIT